MCVWGGGGGADDHYLIAVNTSAGCRVNTHSRCWHWICEDLSIIIVVLKVSQLKLILLQNKGFKGVVSTLIPKIFLEHLQDTLSDKTSVIQQACTEVNSVSEIVFSLFVPLCVTSVVCNYVVESYLCVFVVDKKRLPVLCWRLTADFKVRAKLKLKRTYFAFLTFCHMYNVSVVEAYIKVIQSNKVSNNEVRMISLCSSSQIHLWLVCRSWSEAKTLG